jgi:uncharacterized membrane protein
MRSRRVRLAVSAGVAVVTMFLTVRFAADTSSQDLLSVAGTVHLWLALLVGGAVYVFTAPYGAPRLEAEVG